MQRLHKLNKLNTVNALNLNTAKKTLNENKFEKDFIPIIEIDYSLIGKKSEYDYTGFIVIDTDENVQLSSNIHTNKRNPILKIIKLFNENVIIPFKIFKGNKLANDDDGIIRIDSDGIEVLTKKSITVELNETIAIKVSSKNLKKDAKIDFYASDDGGFFDTRGLQNIFVEDLSLLLDHQRSA